MSDWACVAAIAVVYAGALVERWLINRHRERTHGERRPPQPRRPGEP